MTPKSTVTPVLKLKKKIVIPRETVLKEWKDGYEAVIGLNKDCVVYLRTYTNIIDEAPEYFRKA